MARTRRVSPPTAARLIAEAESRGQHDHAENLRKVWRELESETVHDLMATIEHLKAELAELRERLAEREARQ